MRWVTYRAPEGDRVGIVVGDDIHALPTGTTLLELISGGAESLEESGLRAQRSPASVVRVDEVELAAPIPRPPAIRDCLCFLDHMRNCQEALGMGRELKDVWYRVPVFYFACPSTVLGPNDDVPIAPGSAWQDFELEIAAVIGGPGGANLSVADAERQIIGYTVLNDWSARDLQMLDSQLGIGQSKGKDSATTFGPVLVTPDELEPYMRDGVLSLQVTASVNGVVIGSGSTGSMDWSFPEVISYASRGVPLRPGDVFGSGTVPTCTLVEHLRVHDLTSFGGWLRNGDVVTLEVEALGRLRQTVRASAQPHPLPERPRPGASAPTRVNSAPAKVPYTRGLHSVADHVWAWTLPDGGFGWSNAGLVTGDGESLLVDTLFDTRLTREMLDAMTPTTDVSPIGHALITHSNGDHTHGTSLLGPSVRILAATATAEEIAHDIPPEMFAFFQKSDLGPVATPYVRDRFGAFDFGGVTVRNADATFDSEVSIEVGSRRVDIYNLGPAHTGADSVVHVPDAGVLFGGDLLFFGCTPIVWSGPIANWVKACDVMIALDASIVVPGHGPVGDPDGIRRVRDYLEFVREYADAAHRAGQSFREAADRIDLGEFRDWLDGERVVVNVYQRYREIDSETPQLSVLELFTWQAEWHARTVARA